MTLSSNFLITFCFYCQVTGPSFMSILSLVPDLWQFSSIRDWPEIRKLEIPPLDFCPISGDWGELEISNLPRMCLMKCYWVLAKYQGYSFYCFWVGKIPPALPIKIRAKNVNGCKCRNFYCCLVVIYYFETVLKNFGKWYCYRFHTFHQAFYKNFVILVFWISALHFY